MAETLNDVDSETLRKMVEANTLKGTIEGLARICNARAEPLHGGVAEKWMTIARMLHDMTATMEI